MFDLGTPPPRRRASLTPMIDVVFLLLVFFMLAARFGLPSAQPLTLAPPVQGATWEGPPRLITVRPEAVLLNGVATSDPARALEPLMAAPSDPVLLRAAGGASVQDLLDVLVALREAGLSNLAVVE